MVANPLRWYVVALILLLLPTAARGQAAKKVGVPDQGLVMGDVYTLRAERQGVYERFKGNLVKLNDRWIVLRRTAEHQADEKSESHGLFPFLGRKSNSEQASRVDELLWIPRDAATVESHTQATDRAAAFLPTGDAPPEHAACDVQLVHAGKSLRRQGGIEAVSGDSLTVSVPKKVKTNFAVPSTPEKLASISTTNLNRVETHYVRHHFATREILCVHVVNFDISSFESAP